MFDPPVLPVPTERTLGNNGWDFNKLTKTEILKIVNKVKDETNVMLKDKKVVIDLDANAVQWICDKGYNPAMGARPMQRIFDQNIKKPLAKEILFGKLINGGNVLVKIVNDKIELEIK